MKEIMDEMIVSVTCRVCGNPHELRVDMMDYFDWEDGELIQNAMPYLSPSERELLISGICGGCFHEMFGEI